MNYNNENKQWKIKGKNLVYMLSFIGFAALVYKFVFQKSE